MWTAIGTTGQRGQPVLLHVEMGLLLEQERVNLKVYAQVQRQKQQNVKKCLAH